MTCEGEVRWAYLVREVARLIITRRMSERAIARELHVSRPTVKKMAAEVRSMLPLRLEPLVGAEHLIANVLRQPPAQRQSGGATPA
jgi:hypothetical protein